MRTWTFQYQMSRRLLLGHRHKLYEDGLEPAYGGLPQCQRQRQEQIRGQGLKHVTPPSLVALTISYSHNILQNQNTFYCF